MPDASAPELTAIAVRHVYPRAARPALERIDVSLPAGRWTALVGPNGAGKSTLLRVLSGVLRPTAGEARFRGRPLSAWSRRALARRLAVVAQEPPPSVPFTVREFVELGRNPYVRPWAPLDESDRRAVHAALERCEVLSLADRAIDELSGGERQRAKLARGLAQEPETLLLDEPTAHLDPGHAVWFFELLAGLRTRRGVTVVSATHDLNLASRYADRLVLLDRGRIVAEGDARAVLRPEALEAAYGWPMRVEDLGTLGRVVIPLPPAPRAVAGVAAAEAPAAGGVPAPGGGA